MFPYGWSVLGLGFGLLVLSIYPMAMGSFVLRVEDDSKVYNKRNIEQNKTTKKLASLMTSHALSTMIRTKWKQKYKTCMIKGIAQMKLKH